MRISATKDNLLKGLQIVQNAVSAKATLPILANILLEADNDKLQITATDLDIGISTTIPADVKEKGGITIPAKKFLDIIKEMSSDSLIEISVKPNLSIQINSSPAFFKLTGIAKDDFPKIPAFQGDPVVKIPSELLKDMLRLTVFAVSRDEARYVLNGILFSFQKKTLKLVATDGRRLAVIEKKLKEPLTFERDIIVPSKAVHELNRNLGAEGEVEIGFKENQLQFKSGETVVTTRLIEGEYPNYQQVIPKETKEQLWLDTQKFLSATRRASIFTNQESQSIKLDLSKNRMVISKNTPDVGEVREELATQYDGGAFTIGFNPSYLIDALKNIGEDKVCFELIDPEKPGVIKVKDDYTYIILPMQLT